MVAGETGITLNNRAGRGFSLVEGHPNVIAPGKRTMHTLNAYLGLRDGQPWLVGGTPGGDQQTQWNAQIITAMMDHGLVGAGGGRGAALVQLPGHRPGHRRPAPGRQRRERVPARRLRDLEARGHVLEIQGPWGGGGAVQLIEVDRENGVLRGGSDPRPGGLALGI